jgi:hypothetical protein
VVGGLTSRSPRVICFSRIASRSSRRFFSASLSLTKIATNTTSAAAAKRAPASAHVLGAAWMNMRVAQVTTLLVCVAKHKPERFRTEVDGYVSQVAWVHQISRDALSSPARVPVRQTQASQRTNNGRWYLDKGAIV